MKARLAQITYKPNWNFAVRPCHSPYLTPEFEMRITINTQDANDPSKTLALYSVVVLPPLINGEDDFDRIVFSAIQRAEAHEAHEWFRRNGKMVFPVEH